MKVDLDRYEMIKMSEKDIINFISAYEGDEVFEFKGTNGQKMSMYRGSKLHLWLIEAFNELADIARKQKRPVYLIELDSMIQEESKKYYERKIKK